MTTIALPERKIILPPLDFPRWLRFPRGASDERVARMFSGAFRRPFQSAFAAGDAAAWTPASKSGLQIWLTTPISGLANNDPVSSWTDASGNGNTPTQSGSARPTYLTVQTGGGNAAVQGDGTSRYLVKTSISFSGLGNGNYTIFFVAKAGSATRILFYVIGGGGQIYCYQNIGGKQRVNQKDNASAEINSGVWDVTAPTSAFYYCVITRSGTTFTQRVNGAIPSGGTQTATLSTTTTNNLYLLSNQGISAFNDGYLAEFGIYNSALTGADLTQLETYLAAR